MVDLADNLDNDHVVDNRHDNLAVDQQMVAVVVVEHRVVVVVVMAKIVAEVLVAVVEVVVVDHLDIQIVEMEKVVVVAAFEHLVFAVHLVAYYVETEMVVVVAYYVETAMVVVALVVAVEMVVVDHVVMAMVRVVDQVEHAENQVDHVENRVDHVVENRPVHEVGLVEQNVVQQDHVVEDSVQCVVVLHVELDCGVVVVLDHAVDLGHEAILLKKKNKKKKSFVRTILKIFIINFRITLCMRWTLTMKWSLRCTLAMTARSMLLGSRAMLLWIWSNVLWSSMWTLIMW